MHGLLKLHQTLLASFAARAEGHVQREADRLQDGRYSRRATASRRRSIAQKTKRKLTMLQPGESIRVDTRSVVAFTSNVDYDVTTSGDCAVMLCGGEGIFNAKFTATNTPGLVLVQSMSLEKLKALFHRPRPPRQQNANGLAGQAAGI